MAETDNADQIAYWNGQSGRKWADDADKMDAMMRPVTAAVLAAAQARPGESVLDIGCGSGGTALAIADAVGPDGRVLGVDISQPMLAVARERGAARPNVQFVEADAASHAFKPASFDLVFSRFGVMFFADPLAAFANFRKAVKQGGRLTFACWRAQAENPFATIPMSAALRQLPPQPAADPHAPGPFAFADETRVSSMLQRAGFIDPKFAAFDTTMVIGRSAASAAKEAVLMGMASRLLKDADEVTKLAVISELTDTYAGHVTEAGVTLPARVWIVTAGV